MVGATKKKRSNGAWLQVYRHLEHNYARSQCAPTDNGKKITFKKFPKAVQDFASTFVTMQSKRHDADYDPFAKFKLSAVKADLASAQAAIDKFEAVPLIHKNAFAAWVLLKVRN